MAVLTFAPEHRESILAHARACAPEECCGVLIGHAEAEGRRAVRVVETVAAENVADGDRRRRFAIDPRCLLDSHKRARRLGLAVVGYYHSHPAGAAEPSARDRAHAWPDASYLIVGPIDAPALRSWRLDRAGGTFHEETVAVTAPGTLEDDADQH